jgi:hypothetical protein
MQPVQRAAFESPTAHRRAIQTGFRLIFESLQQRGATPTPISSQKRACKRFAFCERHEYEVDVAEQHRYIYSLTINTFKNFF